MRQGAKALFLISGAVVLAAQEPIGEPFLIHEFSAGRQERSDVAVQPARSLVVVWASEGADGDSFGIRMRRFSGNGIPLTAELPVNQHTAGSQYRPRVATDALGNFVVVWYGPGVSGYDVFARHFTAEALPLGDEFVVNASTAGDQWPADVDRNEAGRFVVAWRDDGNSDVLVTVLDPPATTVVSERVVNNSGEHPAQIDVASGIGSDGRFAVIWQDAVTNPNPAYTDVDIFQRRFSPTGVPLSGEVQLSEPIEAGYSAARRPDVGFDDRQGLRVAWQQQINLVFSAVNTRRTDPQGTVGPLQELATSVTAFTFSTTGPGDFVVTFSDYYRNSGRRFDAQGGLLEEFHAGLYSATSAAHLSDDSRDLVLIQYSSGNDGNPDLYGQRFGNRLFEDGFELGDTAMWSQTVN